MTNPYEPPSNNSSESRTKSLPKAHRIRRLIPGVVGLSFVTYWLGGLAFLSQWQRELNELPQFKQQAQITIFASIVVCISMFTALMLKRYAATITCGIAAISLQILLSIFAVQSGMVTILDAIVASVPICGALIFIVWLCDIYLRHSPNRIYHATLLITPWVGVVVGNLLLGDMMWHLLGGHPDVGFGIATAIGGFAGLLLGILWNVLRRSRRMHATC